MNFLEAFEELDMLTEESNGGQKTYKDFLVEFADFLQIPRHSTYDPSWVLHHVDCDHFNNKPSNIVLMNDSHHRSLHTQLKNGAEISAADLLKSGTMKAKSRKGEKFDYWPIGADIIKHINTIKTETDIPTIISGKQPTDL